MFKDVVVGLPQRLQTLWTTYQSNSEKKISKMDMLDDEIGKGAYGRVYKGFHLENGDFVAIKQVSLENISQEHLKIIIMCTNHLSTDAHCLENLRADTIIDLIPNLDLKEGPLLSLVPQEINKRRKGRKWNHSTLDAFYHVRISIKTVCFASASDMAHASRNSREQLRGHGGLDVYLSLLDNDICSVIAPDSIATSLALDSIAICLAHDNDKKKVDQALLRKDAYQKLVSFFQCCPGQHFVHILEPFLKIITKSSRINTTLAVSGLTPLLISRLDH